MSQPKPKPPSPEFEQLLPCLVASESDNSSTARNFDQRLRFRVYVTGLGFRDLWSLGFTIDPDVGYTSTPSRASLVPEA